MRKRTIFAFGFCLLSSAASAQEPQLVAEVPGVAACVPKTLFDKCETARTSAERDFEVCKETRDACEREKQQLLQGRLRNPTDEIPAKPAPKAALPAGRQAPKAAPKPPVAKKPEVKKTPAPPKTTVVKGEKGDKGDPGAPGAQGPRGLKGDKGDPGTTTVIHVRDGQNGRDGKDGQSGFNVGLGILSSMIVSDSGRFTRLWGPDLQLRWRLGPTDEFLIEGGVAPELNGAVVAHASYTRYVRPFLGLAVGPYGQWVSLTGNRAKTEIIGAVPAIVLIKGWGRITVRGEAGFFIGGRSDTDPATRDFKDWTPAYGGTLTGTLSYRF